MAISTSSYFSNSIVGIPQVAGEGVDLYESTQNPRFALGTKFERQDGCVFRYAQFSTAATAGRLMSSTEADISVAYATSNTCTAPTSTYQMPQETVGVYPGAIGSRYLISAVTGSAANSLAGAYLSIVAGPGLGYTYRIRSNTASGTPATGVCRLELYDAIKVAVTAASYVTVRGCKYNDLADATTASNVVAGVNLSAKTASYFGWIQTRGIIGVYTADLLTIGQTVSISSAGAGAVAGWIYGTTGGTYLTNTQPIVGYVATVGTNTGYTPICLTIE